MAPDHAVEQGREQSEHFREVLSHFPTGVVIVTGLAGDEHHGLAVGSFCSVSLNPRLVGFCVDRKSTSWPPIRAAGRFCVNVLAWDQQEVCEGFARSGGSKFADVDFRTSTLGSPILDGCVAWIDCELEADYAVGDHDFVVGRVAELEIDRAESPMVFHRGRYPGLDLP